MNQFRMIRGGLLDSAATSDKKFISAYTTNTRLMGVLGMYIHWELPDNSNLRCLHQFFYFDCEEYGFETYESILGDDEERRHTLEDRFIGGLGGEKVPLSQPEAFYVLQSYVRMNKTHHIPMPEGQNEYGFILKDQVTLSEPDIYILLNKICVAMENQFEVINYFIMRCVACDFYMARYLSDNNVDCDVFGKSSPGTLCMNNISPGKTENRFLNQSLIEWNSNYYIAVTAVELNGMRVSSFELTSMFKITPHEAAMMLSRSEYVSVFNIAGFRTRFKSATTDLSKRAMMTSHDLGNMYMIFHPNNKHVGLPVYRLNEDVMGIYFSSNTGEFIVASYSLRDMEVLEGDLHKSGFGNKLISINKYEFQEPVLYEFIESGFDFFSEFVEAIQPEE